LDKATVKILTQVMENILKEVTQYHSVRLNNFKEKIISPLNKMYSLLLSLRGG